MIGLDAVKQMRDIEALVRDGIQAISSGEDTAILVDTMTAILCRIHVAIHDNHLSDFEQLLVFAELAEQVIEDRERNIKVQFFLASPLYKDLYAMLDPTYLQTLDTAPDEATAE